MTVPPDIWLFALTSLLLNITPGNDMLYVMTRSAGQGTKAGIISALGIMAGCLVHTLAAAVGLSAIIVRSAMAFKIILYTGAAYLIYLGFHSLLTNQKKAGIQPVIRILPYRQLFWQGVLTNVLNPKVALFFLAFLPQFVDLSRGTASGQILFLGLWFDLSGTLVNVMVALLFGKIGRWMAGSPRAIQWQQRITGFLLIGLGIKVALTSRK